MNSRVVNNHMNSQLTENLVNQPVSENSESLSESGVRIPMLHVFVSKSSTVHAAIDLLIKAQKSVLLEDNCSPTLKKNKVGVSLTFWLSIIVLDTQPMEQKGSHWVPTGCQDFGKVTSKSLG